MIYWGWRKCKLLFKEFFKDFLNNNFMFLKEHHVLLCKTVNVYYLKKYF